MRVVQYGCFGTKNYGDEESARVVRELVSAAFPETPVEFSLVGVDATFAARAHPGVAFVQEQDKQAVRTLCQGAEVLIYGPGTVVGSTTMPSIPEILQTAISVVIWGAGANPVSPGSIGDQLVKRASYVSLRDKGSQAYVLPYRPDAQVVGDPMLYDTWGVVLTPSRQAVDLSFSLTYQTPDVKERVYSAVAEATIQLGGAWVGLPASWEPTKWVSWDDDRPVMEPLCHRVPFEIVTPANFRGLSNQLLHCSGLLTSRLHTGVFVLGNGGNAVLFGPNKMRFMAEELGCPAKYAGVYETLTAEALVRAWKAPLPETKRLTCLRASARDASLMRTALERALRDRRVPPVAQ